MLTITDLFCGAGGSSSGAELVPGVRVRMAANHWALAVDTHQLNLPHADHDTANISQTDPRRYPTTDLLWASPECTKHSKARGKVDAEPNLFDKPLPDEAAQRSRATMWDVVRFAEHHAYRGIIVENVLEVMEWGAPVAAKGALFRAWLSALRALGYEHRLVSLNSMFAARLGPAAPQSRNRVYILLWRAGERAPDLDRWTRPAAWCPRCDEQVVAVQAWKNPRTTVGRYGSRNGQYVWRCPSVSCRNSEVYPMVLPAVSVIDWTTPGERIGDRKVPLVASTMARIRAGVKKYGFRTMVVPHRPHGVARPAADHPVMAVSAGGTHHGLLVPCGGSWNEDAVPTWRPFRTRTTTESEGILMPPALVMRNQNSRGGNMCTPVDEPLRTVTASVGQSLIQMPWMVVDYGGPARPIYAPLPTQTTIQGDALCSVEEHIEDCFYRMLTPEEIKGAMAFTPGYRILGDSAKVKIRQLGNAVTPPAARDLVAAVVEAITGVDVDRPEYPTGIAA